MMIRAYEEERDYDALVSWWAGHDWPAVPAHLIPPFAWVVDDEDGVGRAFACAYLDNGGTGMAMMEWLVTNPANGPRESLKALRTLIPFMLRYLDEELDYSSVLVVCRQPALSRLLEKMGCGLTDEGARHHLWVRTEEGA